jgi:hypothetical protein
MAYLPGLRESWGDERGKLVHVDPLLPTDCHEVLSLDLHHPDGTVERIYDASGPYRDVLPVRLMRNG